MAILTDIDWRGAEEEQMVARTVFQLLAARARFFSEQAPVRQRLEDLQRFFLSQESLRLRADEEEMGRLLEQALGQNDHVFAREDTDGGVAYVTTKAGRPPADSTRLPEDGHSFKSRLFEGAREPTSEDLKTVRGVVREIPEIIMTTPEPVYPVFADDVPDVMAPEEAPEAVQEEIVAAARAIRVGDQVIDLSQDPAYLVLEHGNLFKEMLARFIDEDFRFVRFGDEYYIEDRLERLSKGQLRDIREYITERNEPLTDEELLSDALRRPLQNADYTLWRFTINYRLLREKKDFRFVGTADDRLWATTALALVSPSPRKATELAQDYRYLTDPELSDDDPVQPASSADTSGRLELRHTLTWYESENGVLPVGRGAQLLMPNPLLDDQPVVMLRVQDPQNYASYLAELRLGAGGRGAYIAGLQELFQSTLVPGAVFSLVQGEHTNEYTIEYERQAARESRLLQWDPRRERWFFAPVLYESPVDPSFLLTEDKVGKLNGRKRATETERKRLDALLQTAFEIVGEPADGGGLTALVDDLLPVVNIDRPVSRRYLESVIESAQYPQFSFEDPSIGLASYTQT